MNHLIQLNLKKFNENDCIILEDFLDSLKIKNINLTNPEQSEIINQLILNEEYDGVRFKIEIKNDKMNNNEYIYNINRNLNSDILEFYLDSDLYCSGFSQKINSDLSITEEKLPLPENTKILFPGISTFYGKLKLISKNNTISYYAICLQIKNFQKLMNLDIKNKHGLYFKNGTYLLKKEDGSVF